MKPLDVAGLIFIGVSVLLPQAAEAQRTPEQNLAIIEDGGKENTRKRFKFLLTTLVRICSDIKTEREVSDKLAMVSRLIKEAGIKESLLESSENLNAITRDIRTGIRRTTYGCVEPWSAYAMLRQQGFSSKESKEAAVAFAVLKGGSR